MSRFHRDFIAISTSQTVHNHILTAPTTGANRPGNMAPLPTKITTDAGSFADDNTTLGGMSVSTKQSIATMDSDNVLGPFMREQARMVKVSRHPEVNI